LCPNTPRKARPNGISKKPVKPLFLYQRSIRGLSKVFFVIFRVYTFHTRGWLPRRMESMARELTPKQERFVAEYLVDLNATQAAVRAKYSPKSAARIGQELLNKTHIAEAIQKAQARRAARSEITADQVVRELARVAFADPRRVFIWGRGGVTLRESVNLTDDEAAVVSEVSQTVTEAGGSIKAKLCDKVKALELLGRHLGMFTDKINLSGGIDLGLLEKARERARQNV